MIKKALGIIIILSVMLMGAPMVFAQDEIRTTAPRFDFAKILEILRQAKERQNIRPVDGTVKIQRPVNSRDLRIPGDFDLSCVQGAIKDRDEALNEITEDFYTAMMNAREDRTNNVLEAWEEDTTEEINEALKQAHKIYKDKIKELNREKKADQRVVFADYKSEMKECVDDDFEAEGELEVEGEDI